MEEGGRPAVQAGAQAAEGDPGNPIRAHEGDQRGRAEARLTSSPRWAGCMFRMIQKKAGRRKGNEACVGSAPSGGR